MVLYNNASVAQWIEQDPSKVLVGSSNLPWGTISHLLLQKSPRALKGKVDLGVRIPCVRQQGKGSTKANLKTILFGV